MLILQRYILRELAAPVFLSILFFTFILLIGQLFDMAELLLEARVGWALFLELLSVVGVSLMILTIPMAALLGCLMGIGRLTAENELLAMRVAGVSLPRIFWPVFFFAFVGSCVLMYASFEIIPRMVKGLADRETEIQFRILTNMEPGQNREVEGPNGSELYLYFDKRLPSQPGDSPYTLRMKHVAMRVVGDASEITGADIREERGNDDDNATTRTLNNRETVLFAREGVVIGNVEDRTVTFKLFNGTVTPMNPIVIESESKDPLYREDPNRMTQMRFQEFTQTIPPRLRGGNEFSGTDPRRFTLSELLQITSQEPDEEMYESSKRRSLNDSWKLFLNARNELFQRVTLPFSLLAFVMIAIPLAVELRPRAKTVSFLIAIGLIGLYYVMLTWARAIGMTYSPLTLPAYLLPNLLIGGIGIFLFWRSQR